MFKRLLGQLRGPKRNLTLAETKDLRILICSGSSRVRFPTSINHAIYAKRHGYRYRFGINPHPDLHNIYYHKIATILDAIQDCDWLFWLDDDAAFMQLDVSLEYLVPEMHDEHLIAIYCQSPVNRGIRTWLSAGNFLIRNSPAAIGFLQECLRTTQEETKTEWKEEVYGPHFGGDQEVMIHQIMRVPERRAAIEVLDYHRFNTRPFHFEQADDHFLVHFTHHPERTKSEQMSDFAARFELSEFLVSKELSEPYALYFGEGGKLELT